MPLTTKTKQQLTAEISALRRRVKELEKAGTAQQEQEEQYHTLIEQAADGIFTYDEQGNYTAVNAAGLQMLGYTEEELLKLNLKDTITLEDQEAQPIQVEVLLSGETLIIERQLLRKDGTTVSAEISAKMLTDGRIQGIVRDLTGRMQVEEALQLSEEKLRSIIQTAGSIILVLSPEYKILEWNEEAERIYGPARDEVIGKDYLELFIPPDYRELIKEDIQKVLKGESTVGFENPILSKDGTEYQILWNVSRLLDRESNPIGIVAIGQDITGHKQMEEGLRESEERFRSIYEQSPVGIEIYDADGHLLEVNRECLEMFGIESVEAVQGFKLFTDPNVPADAKARLLKHETVKYEARFDFDLVREHNLCKTTKTGQCYMDTLITPLGDSGGQINGYLVHVRDITDRKRAEEALRGSEGKYRDLVETSQDLIWQADNEGRFTFLNAAWERVLGYGPDEMLGRQFGEFKPPEFAVRDLKTFKSVLGGGQVLNYETVYLTKSGDQRHLVFKAAPRYDRAGKIIGTQGTANDISERKNAEIALRESEERFRTVADFTYDWETWVDPEGKSLYVSPSCERISGYSAEEFLNDPELLRKITHQDDREMIAIHYGQPMETLEGTPLDFRIIHRSGVTRWISHVCQPVITGDGEFLGRRGSNRDITQRKQIETEHDKLFRQLEGKNKDLEQIIHVSSHDLRSPLISIKGFSEVVIDAVDKLPAMLKRGEFTAEQLDELQQLLANDIVKPLEFITAGAEKMDALLSGLMRLSRFGQLALTIEPLDMKALLEEVVRGIQFQVDSTGAELVMEDLPSCLGDEVQVNQLFTNLLDNALKYLDPQRPGRIEVSGRQVGRRVEYCVADNGIGIAPEDQELVFILFHRVDTGASAEGDGLGLSIIRKILDRHGGDIRLESEPGVGSRFFVNLPAGR